MARPLFHSKESGEPTIEIIHFKDYRFYQAVISGEDPKKLAILLHY